MVLLCYSILTKVFNFLSAIIIVTRVIRCIRNPPLLQIYPLQLDCRYSASCENATSTMSLEVSSVSVGHVWIERNCSVGGRDTGKGVICAFDVVD